MRENNPSKSRVPRWGTTVWVGLACLVFLTLAAAPVQAKTSNVPGDYRSIQEAVNHSAAGDTIVVDSGTYAENVVIDRAVTVTGRDTGHGMPVVDGRGKDGITIKVGRVTLQGFRVINASYGIYVSCDYQNSASYNNVIGNVISDSAYGIIASGFVSLAGNTANKNKYTGIKVSTSGARVTGNTANDNGDNGFFIDCTFDVDISGNTAKNNRKYGILLSGPYTKDNIVSGNTAEHNGNGIGIGECTNVTLKGNTAGYNDFAGIYLLSNCSKNSVTGNTADNNVYVGICLDNTKNVEDNTITGNNVYNNSRGGVCVQPYSSYGHELNNPQYSTDFSRGGNIVRDNSADHPGPTSVPAAVATPAPGATVVATGQPTAVPVKPDNGSGASCCPALLIPLLLPGIVAIGLRQRGKQGRE